MLLCLGAGCGDPTALPGSPLDGSVTEVGDAGIAADVAAGSGDARARMFRAPAPQACGPESPSPSVLRVVSWNIATGRITSLANVAEEIRRLDPDVLLLQEVDVGTDRSGQVDQPQVLAEALGMQHTFAETVPWDGGLFGMAILSRLSFSDVQVRYLDPTGAIEQRAGLSAWICRGATRLRFVSFHGDHISPDSAARNAAELARWVKEDIGSGSLIAGDFNAQPTAAGPRAVQAAGFVDLLLERDPRPTFGDWRIDFAFADPGLAATVTAARVEASAASDHLPLLVEIGGQQP